MKDKFGTIIETGDLVVYGESSRYNPINVGIVKAADSTYIEVLGEGNSKTGLIGDGSRVIVLPDWYKLKGGL